MDLKKAIKKLMELSDVDFSWYHLISDPIEGKINYKNRKEIINSSLKCGYEQADIIRNQIILQDGKPDLVKLCERLDIKIKEEKIPKAMDYIYFGTYEHPGLITIYTDNIQKGQELALVYGIRELADENLKDIVLAHEIFHHIENLNQSLFVNTYRIKLWKLGPYTHRSPLICTGEIAGMAFARRLLNLNFCPNVLDVMLLYPYDKVQAERLYDQIVGCSLNSNLIYK